MVGWLGNYLAFLRSGMLFTEIVGWDVVGYDIAPCHIPCNNPSVPPMWIFYNTHHARAFLQFKSYVLHIKSILKWIEISGAALLNLHSFFLFHSKFLCSPHTLLSKVTPCRHVSVVSEARSGCEISPGVKSICYNPSDANLSHTLPSQLHRASLYLSFPFLKSISYFYA